MTYSYDKIRTLLATGHTAAAPDDFRTHAAVALVLRMSRCGLEVLFIERATRDGDPWSGDLGFPGGKVEPEDDNEQRAAERETLEELSVDLTAAEYLGRIPDIAGAHMPVRVSCFVYGLLTVTTLNLQDEVRRAFWIPLEQLFDPERHIEAPVRFNGSHLVRRAIRLLDQGQPVLWGITYRLVIQFLQRLDCPATRSVLPCPPASAPDA